MNSETRTMRDVFIEQIYIKMRKDKSIFFLSADFGSAQLDRIRKQFKERFINVGIAEQNLINTAAGLALEGFTVYAYAISAFLSMRAYEQIRVNLSFHAQLKKEMNVNLIGVGAGASYDLSGPSHHCFEDLSIMRTLPNLVVFSPSDWVLAKNFIDYSIKVKMPKYIRFDGKPLPRIYSGPKDINWKQGFCEIKKGGALCLVSTGFMTHQALKAARLLAKEGIDAGVIDVFILRPMDEVAFLSLLKNYKRVVTIEEGFINKGGLDALVSSILERAKMRIKIKRMGFDDRFIFDVGDRRYLHKLAGLDEESIVRNIREEL